MKAVPKLDESESGQMVLKQVKWALSSVYLSQTMWNPTKNSMKRLKRPTSVILQGNVRSSVLKTPKNTKT